jgi:hypothetical protein
MSKALAGLTTIIGLVIMAIGLSGVAPIVPTTGPAISNPTIPFAAAFWVLGIMVVLLTPLAYVLGKE